MESLHALWTFPAIIFAAMIIAWAAECGQFYISQGLALAVLAWVQTLPEFAVEATIALEAAKNPEQIHLVTANFTGSLRLFVGLGWPLVYFVAVFFGKKLPTKRDSWTIHLEEEQSVAVMTLVPALLYFLFIYFKGTLTMVDSAVLAAIYFTYLFLLSKMPPEEKEELSDLGAVPHWIMGLKGAATVWMIVLFFAIGGAVLFFVAHPFLESMMAVAMTMGVSQFVFVQWLAPFLSEFPEQLSAFRWAKSVKKAPMALANFVSSSINQWTILVATVPCIYSFGMGHPTAILFDDHQKVEILLTIVQSYLGFLFLFSMDFSGAEATGLFLLWITQFFVPGIREEIIYVYGFWALIETVKLFMGRKQPNALRSFVKIFREHFLQKA